jgi:hypothetical protein
MQQVMRLDELYQLVTFPTMWGSTFRGSNRTNKIFGFFAQIPSIICGHFRSEYDKYDEPGRLRHTLAVLGWFHFKTRNKKKEEKK